MKIQNEFYIIEERGASDILNIVFSGMKRIYEKDVCKIKYDLIGLPSHGMVDFGATTDKRGMQLISGVLFDACGTDANGVFIKELNSAEVSIEAFCGMESCGTFEHRPTEITVQAIRLTEGSELLEPYTGPLPIIKRQFDEF